MTHQVAFFIYPGCQVLDLAGPVCAFQVAAKLVAEFYAPEVHVLSAAGGLIRTSAGLVVETTRADLAPSPDTLIAVGGNVETARSVENVAAFKTLAEKARRLASVCTGAFLLAEAGLLNGRRATTHWRFTQRLQKEYPAIMVEGDRLYLAEGSVWTSAGISSGIDLALALIEEDTGVTVARGVAQELVVYHRRPGGQSQFSAMAELDGESDGIRRALSHARDHLTEDLSIETLATVACLSVRHFGRAFKRETGETPGKAVERLRAEAARNRVEEGREAVERIATAVGFGDPERMRRAFMRIFGKPPQAMRREARGIRTQPE